MPTAVNTGLPDSRPEHSDGSARIDAHREGSSASQKEDRIADPSVRKPSLESIQEKSAAGYRMKESHQLLSPSPSPRSRSPSVLVTDSSPTEQSYPQSSASSRRPSVNSDAASPENEPGESSGLSAPAPILTNVTPHGLHDIPEENIQSRRKSLKGSGEEKVLKLSAAEIEELTSDQDSLPVSPRFPDLLSSTESIASIGRKRAVSDVSYLEIDEPASGRARTNSTFLQEHLDAHSEQRQSGDNRPKRPMSSSRSMTAQPSPSQRMSSNSNQHNIRQISPKRRTTNPGHRPDSIELNLSSTPKLPSSLPRHVDTRDLPSPMPASIPLPPMSIPTWLELELSSKRPSPLYIYRSASSEFPYESSRLKFERLLNFLILPPHLECIMAFGSLACLDAWLYTFTILPLRFFKALAMVIAWSFEVMAKDGRFVLGFIYHGTGRMWYRRNEPRDSSDPPSRSTSRGSRPPSASTTSYQSQAGRSPDISRRVSTSHVRVDSEGRRPRQGWGRRHRRSKSQPSSLSSYNKADLIQGAIIVISCLFLNHLDASRMYHSIRAQSAIKLYVIYNGLEVFDRLFSALGQDIFECLYSDETLQRDSNGRSRILRPFGMFILALVYNVIHATTLFYQCITLNVAVNSYSNALLTLLLSNQFVEIKGTVFKKFEKDNLFQLTCADVVERFQLWLMLTIIGLRNIVQVGDSASILPNSFSILPAWSGEVLSPFVIVLGLEMLVDWIKHAYINKFNNVKPGIYQRFLDVLAKDYYTNAFVEQNLVKRIGLPVIPLSCLFIRASLQTYHMFIATHIPSPDLSTATSLSAASSPATTAALERFDKVIMDALGRSALGIPDPLASAHWYLPSADTVISWIAMAVFFLCAFLVLLACKLGLGMVLMKFARNRYYSMKMAEQSSQNPSPTHPRNASTNQNSSASYDTGGRRVGGWGTVEVDDDKRRHIYSDDPATLEALREKERAGKEKAAKDKGEFSKVMRYEMSAKRIW